MRNNESWVEEKGRSVVRVKWELVTALGALGGWWVWVDGRVKGWVCGGWVGWCWNHRLGRSIDQWTNRLIH